MENKKAFICPVEGCEKMFRILSKYKTEYHPRSIPAKFGSNWPSGFGEEA
jgi:hypothetical protein